MATIASAATVASVFPSFAKLFTSLSLLIQPRRVNSDARPWAGRNRRRQFPANHGSSWR
jgi:hypothetical protein